MQVRLLPAVSVVTFEEATSMSRPRLLLCPSRRGDITIQPELYQQACCIGLHLEVVHRGPGHIHTSAP